VKTAPGVHTTADLRTMHPLAISEIREESPDVVSVRLQDPARAALPPWRPGAHLDVKLPSGLIRQYSLCGDPTDRSTYTIAVLKDPHSRGGSVEFHDIVRSAAELPVRGPRNNFELEPAEEYLFLAGGIGITPILPMVRHIALAGDEWALHYGGRTREHMAFANTLDDFPEDQVHYWPQDECGLMPIADIVEATPAGTHIYACGPEPMLQAIAEFCAESPTPRRLRVEKFGAAPAEDTESEATNTTFEVELCRSGIRREVPPNRTVLEVVREALPNVAFSCQQGYCGTCETRVLGGRPDHRDTYLDDDERQSNETMMICVSRTDDPLLRLDL
jgi:ferredoxin-NADP reductase